MSSFRFARLTGGQCVFDQVPNPAITGSLGGLTIAEGTFWNDVTQKNLLARVNGITGSHVQGINVNTTPITATNPSSAAALMTFALPAGYLSVTGKTLRLWAAGAYTTASGQTPTLTFTVLIGGITPLTFVSTATTASVTKTWNVEALITTVTAGTSGTVEAHGLLNIELGGGAAGSVAESSFNDTVTAVSSTQDLTIANTLQLQVLASSSNAGNSVVQRQFVVEVLN